MNFLTFKSSTLGFFYSGKVTRANRVSVEYYPHTLPPDSRSEGESLFFLLTWIPSYKLDFLNLSVLRYA